MKKLVLIVVGLGLVALFLASARLTVKPQSEFLGVVHEINVLTDKAVELMGGAPNLERVNKAKQFVDERKDFIREKLQGFRNEGRLRENSDEFLRLEFVADANKNKIAKVYDELVDKAKADIRSLDEEKMKMVKSNRTLSDEDIALLEQKSKLIEENLDVIKAMDGLMASYETIFEEK